MTLVSYIFGFMTKNSHIFESANSHFLHDYEHYVTTTSYVLATIYFEI